MNAYVDTMSGVTNSRKTLTYEIDTSQVKSYLQNRFSLVEMGAKKRGMIPDDQEPIQIELLTIFLERYAPFLLVLPTSVLKMPEVNESVPMIFRPDRKDGAKMFQLYYELVARLMFSKKEIGNFSEGDWKKNHGISQFRTVNTLRRFAYPKVVNPGGDPVSTSDWMYDEDALQENRVMVWLKPENVFHEMLVDKKNVKETFYANVQGMQRISDSNARFLVEREVATRKRGKSNDELKALIQKRIFK